jgi:hypothetical protein
MCCTLMHVYKNVYNNETSVITHRVKTSVDSSTRRRQGSYIMSTDRVIGAFSEGQGHWLVLAALVVSEVSVSLKLVCTCQ